jgi:hypothetical protein
MKKLILACAAASLALVATTPVAAGKTADKGATRLAKLIEGRTAGEPVSCISARLDNKLEVIDETAIVYDAGSVVYVAKPSDPKSLDTDDVLVINRYGSQLCKQDIIRTVDRMGGFMTGIVFLGDFVPYKKG